MAKRSSPKNGKSPPARPHARKQSRKSKPAQSTTSKTKRSQNTPHGEASSKGLEKAEGLLSARQAPREDLRKLAEQLQGQISSYQALREEIGRLTEQAEAGDHEAVKRLLMTASFSVSGLGRVQVSNPDALKPLLATWTNWPIGITNNDLGNTAKIAKLRKLGFGAEASTGLAAQTYYARRPTVASMIASTLCGFLDACRRAAEIRQETKPKLKLAKSLLDNLNKLDKLDKRDKRDKDAMLLGTLDAVDALQKRDLEAYRILKFAWEAKFKWYGKPLNDEYLESMIEECSKLPQLSDASWKEWFAVARKVFMYLTDGRPEDIPALQKIGGLIFDPKAKQLKFQGQEYRPSKERGKVRDRIVTSIRYAFKIKAVESGLKP